MNTKARTCNEQNVKLFRLSVNSRLFKQCQDFDKMIQARKSSQSKPMMMVIPEVLLMMTKLRQPAHFKSK